MAWSEVARLDSLFLSTVVFFSILPCLKYKFGWRHFSTDRGVLTVEAAIVVPVMLLVALGLTQYLGHLKDVEVTRQAFHSTCLQLTLQDTAALESTAYTSLALAANLVVKDSRVEIVYLFVDENEQGNFTAKLYWVRKAPILGYVITTFVRTGRSVYRANDVSVAGAAQNTNAVYITKTGTKYHKEACFHLKSSKVEITQREAERQNYEACAHCILGVALFEKK